MKLASNLFLISGVVGMWLVIYGRLPNPVTNLMFFFSLWGMLGILSQVWNYSSQSDKRNKK